MVCSTCGNPKTSFLWSGLFWRYCSFDCMVQGARWTYTIIALVLLGLSIISGNLGPLVGAVFWGSLGLYGFGLKERPQRQTKELSAEEILQRKKEQLWKHLDKRTER